MSSAWSGSMGLQPQIACQSSREKPKWLRVVYPPVNSILPRPRLEFLLNDGPDDGKNFILQNTNPTQSIFVTFHLPLCKVHDGERGGYKVNPTDAQLNVWRIVAIFDDENNDDKKWTFGPTTLKMAKRLEKDRKSIELPPGGTQDFRIFTDNVLPGAYSIMITAAWDSSTGEKADILHLDLQKHGKYSKLANQKNSAELYAQQVGVLRDVWKPQSSEAWIRMLEEELVPEPNHSVDTNFSLQLALNSPALNPSTHETLERAFQPLEHTATSEENFQCLPLPTSKPANIPPSLLIDMSFSSSSSSSITTRSTTSSPNKESLCSSSRLILNSRAQVETSSQLSLMTNVQNFSDDDFNNMPGPSNVSNVPLASVSPPWKRRLRTHSALKPLIDNKFNNRDNPNKKKRMNLKVQKNEELFTLPW